MPGIQGIGVSLPWAADVAAAVAGNANDRHLPNGAILVIDLKSEILAIGFPQRYIERLGKTVSLASLRPNEQCKVAPEQTYESSMILTSLLINQFTLTTPAFISILLPAFIAISSEAF